MGVEGANENLSKAAEGLGVMREYLSEASTSFATAADKVNKTLELLRHTVAALLLKEVQDDLKDGAYLVESHSRPISDKVREMLEGAGVMEVGTTHEGAYAASDALDALQTHLYNATDVRKYNISMRLASMPTSLSDLLRYGEQVRSNCYTLNDPQEGIVMGALQLDQARTHIANYIESQES